MSTLPGIDGVAYDRWLTTDPRVEAYEPDAACDDCGDDEHPLTLRHGQGRTNSRRVYHLCPRCLAACDAEGEEPCSVPLRSVVYGGPGLAVTCDADCDPEHTAQCDAGRDRWIECIDSDADAPGEWRDPVRCTG